MAKIQYDRKEMDKTGERYPGFGTMYGFPQTEIINEIRNAPVTPRENFELFRTRQDVCWIPSLLNDFNWVYPDIVPDCVAVGFSGGKDSFGVEWVPDVSSANLPAMVRPGNPTLKDIADWRELEFPDVSSWDWAGSEALYSGIDRSRPTLGILLSGYFERLIALMDFMQAAIALIESPEEVAAFMERLTDYNISVIERYKKHYGIDVLMIHEDWGSQRSPFFSRSCVQETILPAFKRLVTRVHELDIFVIHHCCGNAESLVPDMIETGSDCWQVQLNANPNIYETMKKYPEINFNIIYELPHGISDDDFRANAEKYYQIISPYKNATLDICDPDWLATPKQKDILYELARKTAIAR